jgi:molybdate/tungstate transport system substrate-binding protein
MRKVYVAIAVIAAAVLLASTYFFVANYVLVAQPKQVLKIYCATSLQYPLAKVEADFEKANPNIDVEIQGHGTIQVIRHVTELHEQIDLLMVADYSLIPRMMYPTLVPGTNESYANYYVRFATNSLVLAYDNNSRYASEINAGNWCTILTRADVKLGLANPQLDALGYRTLTAIQLAEDYYGTPTLFHDLITNNMNPPISSIPDGTNYTITVPDIQEPVGNKLTLRASEVDLIALLQTGNLDYCFMYLSNAKQYGFNYVQLPDEINLENPAFQSNYERIQVVYSHKRFATITLDRTGETIYYGLTIPADAPNPALAEQFVLYLLNGQGKSDFDACSHPVFQPSYTDNLSAVPVDLQPRLVAEPQDS